ncbi:aldehyde dehydrogenase family protein [Geodermatophilus sp. YIM 151500]|uniref:aldehyde dehydrogenase family protein n=1 Tax=Geodermatophilus sp. YIM 151500 TaxID=2984531 RepID=UPI0021E4991B|nr:aldehyde dehydrogenase family protein [Geodermatophilus sp. YIM 151500]MCV2488191.1 aldehyde dehydrogenase family protein [Geodermatophilus sp. YIM 151500]
MDLPDAPWRSYVAGQWTAGPDARHYEIVDPGRTRDTVSRYLLATPEDAERAAAAARDAFPAWAETTAGRRSDLVYGLVDLWQTRMETVAEIVSLEMGKPLAESRSEASRAVAELRFWAGEALRLGDRTFPSARPHTEIATIREPIGPVAGITPWNFPILSPLRKVVPALVSGCPVVLKPALQAPGASVHIAAMLHELGVPAGVFGLLIGGGSDVGAALVGHPAIAGITFTGSTDVGLRIAGDAAARNVRLQLEMGGKNAAVVTRCADVDRAAAEISAAAFAVAGQRCTAISRVVVTPDVREPLERVLVEKAAALRVGHGLATDTVMGPIVSKDQFTKIHGYVEQGVRDGARVLTGGGPLTGGGYDDGYYYAPTVVTDVPRGSALAVEEVFGPVLSIVPVDDLEEAIDVANETRYGLTAAIFTDDMDAAHAFVRRSQTGMVHVNHGTNSEGQVPFGGMKQSGQGAYGIGDSAKDFFTSLKAVYSMYRR